MFKNIFNKMAGYWKIRRKMAVNSTKKAIIIKNSRIIDGNIAKFIGLMFSKKKNMALIFKFRKEKKIALHMLFVFYPIDVLFLDKNNIVVDKKDNFKPFTLYNSKKKAMYAVEMPNGMIKKTKTKIGDKIIFQANA